ncbi:glycoside hydrolase family 73 protein [Limosilactobacillus sp.]|uniref:glycoside hydrolase family 73 protein n=1 Tax=Limosilactobacillus sp. TaxID=2773925 RepID=UPI00345EF847
MKMRRIISECLLVAMIVLGTLSVPAQAASFSQAERDRYLTGYRQGMIDSQRQQKHQFQDAFVRAGYERGFRESMQKQQQEAGKATSVPESQARDRTDAETVQGPEPSDSGATFHYNLGQPTRSQKEFFEKLGPLAVKISRQFDLYPSILLAQAALESNFGASELASRHNNLMGVKAMPGLPSVEMTTSEQDHSGHSYTIKAAFRKYKDWQESLNDYANLLETEQFRMVHRHQAGDYQRALKALRGSYATDVHYDQKLAAIIKAFDLTSYDDQLDQPDTKKGDAIKQQSYLPRKHHGKVAVKSHQSKARPAKRKGHVLIMSVAGALASLVLIKVKQLHR